MDDDAYIDIPREIREAIRTTNAYQCNENIASQPSKRARLRRARIAAGLDPDRPNETQIKADIKAYSFSASELRWLDKIIKARKELEESIKR